MGQVPPTTVIEGADAPGSARRFTPPRFIAVAGVVGSITLVARLAAVGRDLAIARQLGTATDLDAFLLAFAVPAFAMTVVAGSFGSVLVPTYIDVRERTSATAALHLLSSVMAATIAILVGLAAILAIGAPVLVRIVGPDLDSSSAALTRRLLLILLPTIVLNGLSTAWTAVLNAEDRYVFPAVATILTPVFPLVAVVTVTRGRSVDALAYGTVIGFTCEAVLVGLAMRHAGLPLRPRWTGHTVAIGEVARQALPMLAGASMLSSTLVVDQAMASTLGPGSVSALNYGGKVVMFALSIATVAITAAVLPRFSVLVARRDRERLDAALRGWLAILVAVSLVAALFLVAVSGPMVRIIFQRGAFTAADASIVTDVQRMFLLQLPFYLAGIVLVRLISALKGNAILMWGAAISVVVNVSLNWLFENWIGVSGIALSTSCVYMVSCGFLWLMVRRRLRSLT